MVDLSKGGQVRAQDLNRALEALHFAFRAVIKKPDEQLARLRLARVHHRLLYFIGRRPESSVLDILKAMQVSKQYLHRPLAQLIQRGFVMMVRDSRDRRVKRLTLTDRGQKLEQQLSGIQRRRFAKVFAESGPAAEQAWHRVMTLLADNRFD
jgi:DNA-binding MarR family transcriptional regulator